MSDHLGSLFEAEISRIEVPHADVHTVIGRGKSLALRRRAAILFGGIALVAVALLVVPKFDLMSDSSMPPAQGDRSRLKENVFLSIESSDPSLHDGGSYAIAVSLVHELAVSRDVPMVCFLMPSWVEEAAIKDDGGNIVSDFPGSAAAVKKGDETTTACGPTDETTRENLVLQPELHHLEMSGSGRTLSAGLAFERAWDDSGSFDETKLLEYQATEALNDGDLDTAEALGQQRLDDAPSPDNWDHGNAIHYGHLILGHVALRRGDIARAKTELSRAGHTEGSPQLDSFGPNMSLARDLLTAGEKEAVIKYIEQLKNFYQYSDDLDGWIAAIDAGQEPDWDRHLGTGWLDPEPYEGN